MVGLKRSNVSRAVALVALSTGVAGTLVLAVSLAVGGYAWTIEAITEAVDPDEVGLRQRIKSSSLAGWWRCLGSDRPVLGSTAGYPGSWVLRYSWTGGYGGGPFEITVDSNGMATLHLGTEGDVETVTRQLPAEEVRRIAGVVDSSRVFCLVTKDRPDHQVVDLGTYELAVTSGRDVRSVKAGRCHYVDDPAAFGAVQEVLRTLDSRFNVEIIDSPSAITTVGRPCS